MKNFFIEPHAEEQVIEPIIPEVVPVAHNMTEMAAVIPALKGNYATPASLDTVSEFPSMTTVFILVTFLLTVFQAYKYFKRMHNSKAINDNPFQNSMRSNGRQPLVSNNDAQAAATPSAGVPGLHQLQLQENFEFDSSEVGSFSVLGNFEEYTGPQLDDYQANS